MAEPFDLIDWHQQQLQRLRARVKEYQGQRDFIEKIVNSSGWDKPTGEIYTQGIPSPLVTNTMGSLEVAAHWLNKLIAHLHKQDAELVKQLADLIAAKAAKEVAQ